MARDVLSSPFLISILVPDGSVAQEPTPTLALNEFIASKPEDIVGVWEALLGGMKASME